MLAGSGHGRECPGAELPPMAHRHPYRSCRFPGWRRVRENGEPRLQDRVSCNRRTGLGERGNGATIDRRCPLRAHRVCGPQGCDPPRGPLPGVPAEVMSGTTGWFLSPARGGSERRDEGGGGPRRTSPIPPRMLSRPGPTGDGATSKTDEDKARAEPTRPMTSRFAIPLATRTSSGSDRKLNRVRSSPCRSVCASSSSSRGRRASTGAASMACRKQQLLKVSWGHLLCHHVAAKSTGYIEDVVAGGDHLQGSRAASRASGRVWSWSEAGGFRSRGTRTGRR